MVLKALRSLAILMMTLTVTATWAAERPHTLKFATLAPPGSTWMNIIEAWAREVEERSEGRLVFKLYPGGVQGDEPDVLRKIRFRQLDGAALTGYGIGSIHSPARVLEMPFVFRSYDEIDHVRAHLMPQLEAGFRAGGFELLGWMEVGWVRLFSQHPIASLDELQRRRVWLWQGDPLGQAWFEASGVSPVPLSITDVFNSLSTGLIDTVYCTPLAALALQWFTKTDYMTDIPMANGIGALVVSSRFYEDLPDDLRRLLKETGDAAGQRLIAATRADNARSLEVLREEGLQIVLGPQDVDMDEVLAMRDRAAARLADSDYIPQAVFDRTWALLETYRQGSEWNAARDER